MFYGQRLIKSQPWSDFMLCESHVVATVGLYM